MKVAQAWCKLGANLMQGENELQKGKKERPGTQEKKGLEAKQGIASTGQARYGEHRPEDEYEKECGVDGPCRKVGTGREGKERNRNARSGMKGQEK